MSISKRVLISFRKLDFWVAVCFTLNYIVGSGFLTLPFAFHEAGISLGLPSMIFIVGLATISMIFLLEVAERAKILKRRLSLGGATCSCDYHAISSNPEQQDIEITHYQSQESCHHSVQDYQESIGEKLLKPGHIFEIPELCSIFLGSTSKTIYLAFITVYLYGVLWAYCTVFASAFATHVPFSSHQLVNFEVYLFVFGVIVVPMSLLELSEQVVVQVSLAVFRIVMLTVMITTVAAAYYSGQPEFGPLNHDNQSSSEDIQKLPQLLSIAAYAFIVHHSTPALSQQVKDKHSLVLMFTCALLFCFVAYCLIGVVLSLYFGASITPSSNLCWEHYVGILNSDGSRPLYAQLISHFVVLFPAVDVASAFPLNAYTLGNNLMSGSDSQYDSENAINRWHVIKYRLIAAVPPFFLASLRLPLGKITSFSGLSAFALMFIFPALLAHYSTKKLEEVGIPTETIHSTRYTGSWSRLIVGVAGVVLMTVTLVETIADN